MLFPSRPTVSLTLIVSVFLTLAVASVEAHQPDHAHLRRLIKKRSPALGDELNGIVNVVGNPNADNSLSNSGSSISTSASASNSASLSQSASSVSASTTETSQSAISTSEKGSSTSASAAAQSSPPPDPPSDPNAGGAQEQQQQSTVFRTSLVSAPTGNSSAPKGGASKDDKAKSTVITVLIAVAASVAGLAIIWTIFRKWKLGHSSKFDDRLAPIDWQPTTGDDGIIPANRRHSGSSSVYSSSTHGNGAGRGAGGYQDHDFTAGPTHLAPVGGYAGPARGPSPQPQMQESLNRGPSMNRPAYDTGVPLHHQASYGRNAEAYDYNGDAVRF